MKYETYDTEDAYTALVNAIMAQAADDYRAALKRYRQSDELITSLEKCAKLPHAPAILGDRIKQAESRRNGAAADIKKLEQFFFSPWASALTRGANMGYIVSKLKREVNK